MKRAAGAGIRVVVEIVRRIPALRFVGLGDRRSIFKPSHHQRSRQLARLAGECERGRQLLLLALEPADILIQFAEHEVAAEADAVG